MPHWCLSRRGKAENKYDNKNLIIIIENSFDGTILKNEKGTILTTKGDKENHGIGLISIQNVVERYNGLMKIEIEEKIFKLSIVLYEG